VSIVAPRHVEKILDFQAHGLIENRDDYFDTSVKISLHQVG
jgi:hypothetical protein